MLLPFTTAKGIPSYSLLRSRGILADSDLTDEPAEHIRQEARDQVGTLNIVGAASAGVELQAGSAGSVFHILEMLAAHLPVLALPPITSHSRSCRYSS